MTTDATRAPRRWLNAHEDEGSHATQVQPFTTAMSVYRRPEHRDPRSNINSTSLVTYYAKTSADLLPDVRLLGALLGSFWNPVGRHANRAVTLSDSRIRAMMLWTGAQLDAARDGLAATGDWTLSTDGLAHLYVPTDALYERAVNVDTVPEVARVLSKWIVRYSGLEAPDRVLALRVAIWTPDKTHRRYRVALERSSQVRLTARVRGSDWSNARLQESGLMTTYTAPDGDTTYRWTETTWERLNEYSQYVWLRKRGSAALHESAYEHLACPQEAWLHDEHPLMQSPPAGHGFVYTLADPREPGAIRYVGQTTQPLALRLRRHLSTASGRMTRDWLRTLVADGVMPTITLYETCALEKLDPRKAKPGVPTREGLAIRRLQSQGHALLNDIVE